MAGGESGQRGEVPAGEEPAPARVMNIYHHTCGHFPRTCSFGFDPGEERGIIFAHSTIVSMPAVRKEDERSVRMPPLRPFEMPDSPATALDIEPEPDEFAIPSEAMTRDELQSLPRAVDMPPLRPEEMPDSIVTALLAGPDRTLDDPSWGVGAKAPVITLSKGKLLHPWDD